MRVESQPAYILHTRNYRDTSLIVEFLTPEFGRVGGIVKGVRAASKSAKQKRAATQPFIPLLISWSGKSDLKTITSLESRYLAPPLQGQRLYSGFYINELLTRLLQSYDGYSDIYTLYEWALSKLQSDDAVDLILRRFELRLLEELGYGVDFTAELHSGQNINPDKRYQLVEGQGFIALSEFVSEPVFKSPLVYGGRDLLSIADGDFTDDNRRAAKRLCRQLLKIHLGDKPLKSRELFL